MKIETENNLEKAIMRYVDALDMGSLVDYVTADLWEYYTNKADEEEALSFIDEMEIKDES